jgi:3-deoxy-manno-octulosonate cytidylyltransferase (CMP-KDO synthetase)
MPTALIPAHLASSRFPRKILIDLGGKPLLWHVWNCTVDAEAFDNVYVVTDADAVANMVCGWGGNVLRTHGRFTNGTERIASLLEQLPGDRFVNVQADMPLLPADLFAQMIEAWSEATAQLITPVYRISDTESLFDTDIVKVVRAGDGTALIFSRQAVPFVRGVEPQQWLSHGPFWAHVGIYGYTRQALQNYRHWPVSPVEEAEKLEQLRFLDHGERVMTFEVPGPVLSINRPDDVDRVRCQLTATERV